MRALPPPPELDARDVASPTARLGQGIVALCHDVGGVVLLLRRALALALFLRVDASELLRQLDRFCVRSLPLVLGGSVIVGGVVAMQGLGYVSRYNATEVFGWAAGMSAFREVAPLLLGLTLASRVGAKNTAELATLIARERLSALLALGLDPERVVVGPRLWAIALSAALLYPIATCTVLFSGFGLAWAIGDQRLSVSWYSMTEYMSHHVVVGGFLRMCAFGALIALASTYFGLKASRDARGIGRAVYSASVASAAGIVVLNLYLSFATGSST